MSRYTYTYYVYVHMCIFADEQAYPIVRFTGIFHIFHGSQCHFIIFYMPYSAKFTFSRIVLFKAFISRIRCLNNTHAATKINSSNYMKCKIMQKVMSRGALSYNQKVE